MSYINKILSVNSDEKTFVKTFIEQLTSADSRITCNADIDEQYANTTNTPTFILSLGTGCNIIFKRQSVLSTSNAMYRIAIEINGVQQGNTINLTYAQGQYAQTATATRTWNFAVISNSNTLCVMLGSYNTTLPSSPSVTVMVISESDFSAAAYSVNANILNSEFYCTDDENKNTALKFGTRLNYAVDTGKIEYIKNKALLMNGTKFSDFSGLCDCSTINKFNFMRIDENIYFSFNENTLIQC